MSKRKSGPTNEKKAFVETFTSKGTDSTASSIIDFAGSIFSAALHQWQQLVTFLSPHVEYVRGVSKKLVFETGLPYAKQVYDGTSQKFVDYSFSKFVADIVNVALLLVLLPLTITVAVLRTIRDKTTSVCGSMCNHGNCIGEQAKSVLSTPGKVVNWFKTTRAELQSGDTTWKGLWNDELDCLGSLLNSGVTYFGEDSKFTWLSQVCKIPKLLEILHFNVELKKE